jgi:hypothetical protein
MKMLHQEIVELAVSQFLNDIEPFKYKGIQRNTINHKVLPGCGATTLEIEHTKRHSILLLPNVPVIQGKCDKYNIDGKVLVLGIHTDTSDKEITDYLASDVEYHKILVTPESFKRLKTFVGRAIYSKYFLLFDECDHVVKDVNYRPDIILPMIDFFLFTNKAFISATPITPSDPRFRAYGFTYVKIRPTFEFKETIRLITSNNVVHTLKQFIRENDRERYFIFCNSATLIADVITKLEISEDSAIYCAKKSRRTLRRNGYKDVYMKLQSFKKYNFLTSRFYAAVDIEYNLYKCDPTIIMLTNLYSAPQTMIDPHSDAIQIAGRFRKEKDITINKEIVHIANLKPKLKTVGTEAIWKELDEMHKAYKHLSKLYNNATTAGSKKMWEEALEKVGYQKYLHKSGSRNFYMIDNLIHEDKVKGYYLSATELKEAYKASEYFNLDERSKDFIYRYTDEDRLKYKPGTGLQSDKVFVQEKLMEVTNPGKYDDMQIAMTVASLSLDYGPIMPPIHKYGIAQSRAFKFDPNKIQQELDSGVAKQQLSLLKHHVSRQLIEGKAFMAATITKELANSINALCLEGLKANLNLMRKLASLSSSDNRVLIGKDEHGKELRGYRIIQYY